MTTATLSQKCEALRNYYQQGIKPVDGRQPIPEDLALLMVQELKDNNVPVDALIGVHDTFLTLTLTLIEYGFTNIVLMENIHKNLTSLQEKYYNTIEKGCDKIGVTYYVPPMNNYNRCDMDFDVVIGNPPFQSNDGNGDLSGSGTGALWWKITETSVKLLKENGIISFITPTNILSGGDSYTKLILGGKRKLDLKNVVTDVNQFFPKVGTKICRWTAQNSVTNGNIATINDDQSVNTDETLKIYNDSQVQKIIQTLINHKGDKFDISVKNTADPRAISKAIQKFDISIKDAARVVSISKKLQKDGFTKQEADFIAKDYSPVQTEDYPYAYNSNGKIKYGKVKWKTYGIWKMMIPHLAKPMVYEIIVSDTMVCDQSCDVQYFDNEEDALNAKQILDNPIYRWIIEQTKVGGRMSTAILSRFPNISIEEVLTADQLSYIQSQL